jgi:hypothetical protein
MALPAAHSIHWPDQKETPSHSTRALFMFNIPRCCGSPLLQQVSVRIYFLLLDHRRGRNLVSGFQMQKSNALG